MFLGTTIIADKRPLIGFVLSSQMKNHRILNPLHHYQAPRHPWWIDNLRYKTANQSRSGTEGDPDHRFFSQSQPLTSR